MGTLNSAHFPYIRREHIMNSFSIFAHASVEDVIRQTMNKISETGNLILDSLPNLDEEAQEQAEITISDLAVKTLLLEDALVLVDVVSRDTAIEMTQELISESLSICSHFE